MDRTTRRLFLIGLLAAVFVAVVLSQFGSDEPDGLEYVAEQEGLVDTAEDHTLSDAPLAEYGEGLTGKSALDTAIAGFIGVLATLALGYGVFWIARRTNRRTRRPAPPS